MLKINCIQSGSKGNCYILEHNEQMIMLDCGSPLLQNYLTKLNLNKLSHVFITHKHGDHCKYINLINRLQNLNLICNDETYDEILKLTKNNCNLNRINCDWSEIIDIPHDAKNNGYILSFGGFKIGYFTDIGHIPENWDLEKFRNLDILLFEANYVDEIINSRDIVLSLKTRLMSGLGHLSFKQSRVFINKIKTKCMKVLFIHRSETNCDLENKIKFLEENEMWLEAGVQVEFEKEK